MKFQNAILVLLVTSSLQSWFNEVLVLADKVPGDGNAQVSAQQAVVGSELPGLPVRTSKGEEDMKHPDMVYGHDQELGKYAPITIRPANYSAHFSKKSGQCHKKNIFLRCCGC